MTSGTSHGTLAAAAAAGQQRSIRVLTLYPDLMDVYADRGNLIALRARAREQGLSLEEHVLSLGDALPEAADLVLIGGGQDREQRLVAPDLERHAATLRAWADEGVAMLAVCGGFQLFGRWYLTGEREELPGAGIFDVTTVAPPPGLDVERCIGDVLATAEPLGGAEVVGFENHAGRTYLGAAARPFAQVVRGFGNNGEDRTEGAVRNAAIGTYLHGPLLPRNVALTDWLLLRALRHREGPRAALLDAAPPPLAARAHAAAAEVARRRGRLAEPAS